MIEVKIEAINKEDLNVDVLYEIANEIFKGNPKEKQANSIKETLKKASPKPLRSILSIWRIMIRMR